MYKVLDLIKAKTKCIWINTYEEANVITDLKEVSTRLKMPMPLYTYSFALGLEKINLIEKDKKEKRNITPLNIEKFLKYVYNVTRNIMSSEEEIDLAKETNTQLVEDANNIFIIKDFHLILDNPTIKRFLRDIVEEKYDNYNVIIVIAPITDIKIEHEKIFSVVDYETPNDNLIKQVLDTAMLIGQKDDSFKASTNEEKTALINACRGLTLEEIAHIFKLSIIKHNTISTEEVENYKIELIKKSNILNYKIPNVHLDEIGGNCAFKKWVYEVIDAMSEEAQEYGCDKPKGCLALGAPGTAKTMMAEAISCEMKVPFLKLDMSKLLDSKVGSSEKNMAQAVRMIKATAPCILLIDEVEKTLSGLQSSGSSDSGTMARMIGAILEFLNEDHGVFVMMTSNDVSQLPPELTRPGRVDAIWYFGMPSEEERKEIFDIHFKKKGKVLSDLMLNYAAKESDKFTGAEIKETVKICMRKSYSRFKKDNNNEITKNDIKSACSEIIPVAKSSAEKIFFLEDYAKSRARFSNETVKEEKDKIVDKDLMSRTLLSMNDLKR
jgi:SpoVK/Ycf46/Vps4 family AAA+-type ATPase